MLSNNAADQLMRDATAVIQKQHATIATLTKRVAHLEALFERSPHIANAVARDPDLLIKTVDLLLAKGDAARKGAAAHSVRDAEAAQVKVAGSKRLFRRHGGNVLPAVSSDT